MEWDNFTKVNESDWHGICTQFIRSLFISRKTMKCWLWRFRKLIKSLQRKTCNQLSNTCHVTFVISCEKNTHSLGLWYEWSKFSYSSKTKQNLFEFFRCYLTKASKRLWKKNVVVFHTLSAQKIVKKQRLTREGLLIFHNDKIHNAPANSLVIVFAWP